MDEEELDELELDRVAFPYANETELTEVFLSMGISVMEVRHFLKELYRDIRTIQVKRERRLQESDTPYLRVDEILAMEKYMYNPQQRRMLCYVLAYRTFRGIRKDLRSMITRDDMNEIDLELGATFHTTDNNDNDKTGGVS